MLALGARRGRHSTLPTTLIKEIYRKEPSSSPISHLQAIRSHYNARVSPARSVPTTGKVGFIEFIRGRIGRLSECSRADGSHEGLRFRVEGRRTISGSRKAGVTAETAAIPAPPVSKLNFVKWYLRQLEERPLLTKSLTAGTIYTSSDLTAQGLTALTSEEEEPVAWDAARSARMLAVGLFMSGPLLHLWFGSVAKLYPNRDLVSTLKKLVLGQVLFGPAFCAAFFSINAYAQGERGSQITERLQRDLLPTLKNGLLYWPACDFITYRHIPVHLQPFVSNCFSFVWTIYLTYMAGKRGAKFSPTDDMEEIL